MRPETVKSTRKAHLNRRLRSMILVVLAIVARSHACQSFDKEQHAVRDSACPRRYSLTDLGIMESLSTDVFPAINDAGTIVLWRSNDGSNFYPLVSGAQITRSVKIPSGYRNAFASSINNREVLSGWANTTSNPVDSSSITHAFIFEGDRALDLGTLGGRSSQAYGINDSGMVVGTSQLGSGEQRAFRFGNGSSVILPPLKGGSNSAGLAINNRGTVVGGSTLAVKDGLKPHVHAVLWHSTKPEDLGALVPQGNSIAYAINNREDVVGVADLQDGETAFVVLDHHLRSLNIKGHAYSINDLRQIVGSVVSHERKPSTAFLWENGVSYDLNDCVDNTAALHLEAGFKITNQGYILGAALMSGYRHFVLLRKAD